jgi:hypothetical protein
MLSEKQNIYTNIILLKSVPSSEGIKALGTNYLPFDK